MKHFSLFILCLLSTFVLSAQSETTTWLYKLDANKAKITNQKGQKIIKIINQNRYDFLDDFLGKTILSAIYNKEFTIYRNKACTNAFLPENAIDALYSITEDTIITFDPRTYEESMKIILNVNQLFPDRLTTYELVQEWNYNEKSNQLESILKSVNVYYSTEDRNSKVTIRHLFSFKIIDLPNVSEAEIMANPNVIWSKEIRYNGEFESQKLIDKLLSKEHLQNNLIYDSSMDKKVENAEIKESQIAIDTIITFDAETFEEEITTVKSELKKSDIKRFKVIQNIYFNKEKNQLQTELYAIAPLRDEYNSRGDYKFSVPIFWIVYDETVLKDF